MTSQQQPTEIDEYLDEFRVRRDDRVEVQKRS